MLLASREAFLEKVSNYLPFFLPYVLFVGFYRRVGRKKNFVYFVSYIEYHGVVL